MDDTRGAGELSQAELDRLAEYFDQTDAGDLPWQDATEVAIERPELTQVSLRLSKDDLAALKHRAAQAGVGHTTLIRMILRRYLRDQPAR